MATVKSLDELSLIAALLADAHASFGVVFDTRALKNTINFVVSRTRLEGISFLTKTLPRLGKHFDQVLAGESKWNAAAFGWKTGQNSELPRFLGELFSLIFNQDGSFLPDPDANCVRFIRQVLYSFYKYELPYDEVQEQEVISSFEKTEEDLTMLSPSIAYLRRCWYDTSRSQWLRGAVPYDHFIDPASTPEIRYGLLVREARRLLNKLFESFDPLNIVPSHGPGVVSTKQRMWDKFLWTRISSRITTYYPIDAYFMGSIGHVCDDFRGLDSLDETDHPAQVLLVPKDSRGPRLISCEPVDNQWIQQGLSRAIYSLVENHPISRWNVFFTDQGPNKRAALIGSSSGRYATLDLKEASDRVHLELVRLLFPERIVPYLECCRSTSTVLPSGKKLNLLKFAPMGSALCFPIMALVIWSLLTASAPDADTRESILVYGDDVIVPTAFAGSAMAILEAFGLKINRAKSCTAGLFRESCGTDAFKGIDVTPVRFRTVWKSSPSPDLYASYIAYANSMWDRGYTSCHELIVERLLAVYGPIPSKAMFSYEACPSLKGIPVELNLFKRRFNKHLQKMQYKVPVIKSPSVYKDLPGWLKLLRYFTEGQRASLVSRTEPRKWDPALHEPESSFSVSRYTRRGTSMLVHRWR